MYPRTDSIVELVDSLVTLIVSPSLIGLWWLILLGVNPTYVPWLSPSKFAFGGVLLFRFCLSLVAIVIVAIL